MQVDKSIFKAYDIRGLYPEQLNEDVVYAMGRAYATLIKQELAGRSNNQPITIAVGADMRLSSPSLKAKLIAGLTDSGINVDDIGLVSTPTFYFGVANYGYLGGIQVSASHNPKQYNGLKIVRQNAVPVSGETGIMDLYQIITDETFAPLAETKGVVKQRSGVVEAFVADFLQLVDVKQIKPFKVVVDAANAMGILDMEALFPKLPCTLVKMNFELDGTFPSHEADPMKPENYAELYKRVVAEKANLGIALDGDADRYFFVDEKGEVVPQQILRGLMALIELKEHPGAKIAYDIRPGRITRDMIEENGGQGVLTRVGHSLIKEQMIKEGAIFGGESSGHYMYTRPYGVFEMPLLLTMKLLRYLSLENKPFSEVVKPYKRYFHSGELNTKVASREEVNKKIEEIKEKYKDGQQNFLDGLTVEYPDYWFNVRGSNTEPLIRLALEARDQKTMETKREEVLKIIRG